MSGIKQGGGLSKSSLLKKAQEHRTEDTANQRFLDGRDARTMAFGRTRVHPTDRQGFVREIAAHWEQTKEHYLIIGEYLIEAKNRLPYGEYTEMVERDLPFSPSIARQLRTVAMEVRSRNLDPKLLPGSYSAAYEIATSSNEEREALRKAGLVGLGVSRARIRAFKKELGQKEEDREQGEKDSGRAAAAAAHGAGKVTRGPDDRSERVWNLQRRRQALLDELHEIERELRDLGAEFTPQDGGREGETLDLPSRRLS